MRLLTTCTLAAAGALALTGCASTVNHAQRHADLGHYNADPSRSRALNVAVATGLTECEAGECKPLSDVPRSELPKSLRTASNIMIAETLADAWSVGHGTAQIAGAASVISGLSSWSAGLLSVGSIFLGPSDLDDPALVPTMIAWMPESMADSPNQAREKMTAIVANALPTGTVQGYQVRVDRYRDFGVAANFAKRGVCGGPIVCAVDVRYIKMPSFATRPPDWLPNGPVYVWTNWQREATTSSDLRSITMRNLRVDTEGYEDLPWPEDLNARAYLAKLSANLPEWVYIYLPPTEAHGYPLILNQGEPLLFVEPL